MVDEIHQRFIRVAFGEALKSYKKGGIPIGAAMVENGKVIARGHNRRVQAEDPIAHGEMDCFREAGRRPQGYDGITLYTTLSPCMMCSGTIVQFGIKEVVVGEDENFKGYRAFLQRRGVRVIRLNDPECISLMGKFIREKPGLWNEDIGGRKDG